MKVFTPPIIAKTLALTSFASLSFMVAAPAQAITFSGNTTGAPTWNRPVENATNPPNSLSVGSTAVPYQVQNFFVGTTGAYNFLSTATFDNYTFIYKNSFSAASPLTNAIIGNDDFPDGNNSGFNGVNLTADTQYYFVNTGFNNSDFGAYNSSITGVGNVTLGDVAAVPWETDALPVVGSTVLFGAGMWAKRKFAQKKIGIENA
ncbi:hypothetical protein [Dolichospermum compactum]|uniref:PEP-CTERM sorting domain-containing protein n=1 Tax=Dolichospermum compactum NIES-806 TaxID=1973481 RepID=A0A1Z4V0J9_9CYAN|nr:hypothetical protein [Dolichospermum compactum]BAZ84953.1 hypothetical protein NIES806_11530 [Dolichospermum compactum NIES-806]